MILVAYQRRLEPNDSRQISIPPSGLVLRRPDRRLRRKLGKWRGAAQLPTLADGLLIAWPVHCTAVTAVGIVALARVVGCADERVVDGSAVNRALLHGALGRAVVEEAPVDPVAALADVVALVADVGFDIERAGAVGKDGSGDRVAAGDEAAEAGDASVGDRRG